MNNIVSNSEMTINAIATFLFLFMNSNFANARSRCPTPKFWLV